MWEVKYALSGVSRDHNGFLVVAVDSQKTGNAAMRQKNDKYAKKTRQNSTFFCNNKKTC